MRLKKYGSYIDYTTAPSEEWGLDTGNICFEETQMFALSIIICVVVFMYTFIRHQDIHKKFIWPKTLCWMTDAEDYQECVGLRESE